MLFQRIYNWCKYKTLPSSFLFKNRLFIERDSKHRRIMSNFGLSFRNSKWSNFEVYNIKNNFRTLYFKYLFYIFFFFFIIFSFLNFKSYYICFYLVNNLTFFFWLSADTFDYYLSFLIWSFTLIFSLFFNLIYSYFFLNDFFNNYNKKNFLNTFSSNNNLKSVYISKSNLNSLLYSWLTNPHSLKNDKILENIFENKINQKWWNENFDFFMKLYKTSYFLNLMSNQNSLFNLANKTNFLINSAFDNKHLLAFFNNNPSLKNYSSAIFSFFLNQNKSYFDLKNSNSRSLIFLKKNYDWNLYNFTNEINTYDYLLKNKNGLFLLTNFNYEKLSFLSTNFQELFLLNNFFKNQLNSSKWNRWLYKYSILHRKILKNSHKITLIKRLINSGFYDSKLFTTNIWATAQLNKLNSNQTFKSFIDVFYGNMLNANTNYLHLNHTFTINNNNSQAFSLNLLNFHETSYFWYLKRFYNFNTLSNNFIKSKVKTYSTFNDINFNQNTNNSLFNQKEIFFTYILNSFYSNNKSLNNIYETNSFYLNTNDSLNNVNFFKDTYLLLNTNTLFTKNNLNILFSLTSSLNNTTNLNFYNYSNYKNSNFLNSNSNFLNSINNSELNFWSVYFLINADKTYVNDIIYINLFI